MLLPLIVFVQFVGCSGVLAISSLVSRCPAGACRQRAAAGLQHLLIRVGPGGGSDHGLEMDRAELVALSLPKADMYPCGVVGIWKTVWDGSGCVRAGTDRLIILLFQCRAVCCLGGCGPSL